MSFLENLSRQLAGTPAAAAMASGNLPTPNANVQAPNSDPGNMQFPAPANQQQPQGGQPNASGGNNQNSGQGNGTSNSSSQQKVVNPIDIFAVQSDNSGSDTPPGFTLDDKSLQTLANGQDFFKGVDPELLNKANSGDLVAQREVQQAAMRNMYQTLLRHQSALTETFTSAREKHNQGKLGSVVRRELAVGSLANTPNFTNPAVRNHLVSLAQQFEKIHPDATAEQIATMARQAVMDMASAIQPQNAGNGNNPGGRGQPSQATDWDAWFNN